MFKYVELHPWITIWRFDKLFTIYRHISLEISLPGHLASLPSFLWRTWLSWVCCHRNSRTDTGVALAEYFMRIHSTLADKVNRGMAIDNCPPRPRYTREPRLARLLYDPFRPSSSSSHRACSLLGYWTSSGWSTCKCRAKRWSSGGWCRVWETGLGSAGWHSCRTKKGQTIQSIVFNLNPILPVVCCRLQPVCIDIEERARFRQIKICLLEYYCFCEVFV